MSPLATHHDGIKPAPNALDLKNIRQPPDDGLPRTALRTRLVELAREHISDPPPAKPGERVYFYGVDDRPLVAIVQKRHDDGRLDLLIPDPRDMAGWFRVERVPCHGTEGSWGIIPAPPEPEAPPERGGRPCPVGTPVTYLEDEAKFSGRRLRGHPAVVIGHGHNDTVDLVVCEEDGSLRPDVNPGGGPGMIRAQHGARHGRWIYPDEPVPGDMVPGVRANKLFKVFIHGTGQDPVVDEKGRRQPLQRPVVELSPEDADALLDQLTAGRLTRLRSTKSAEGRRARDAAHEDAKASRMRAALAVTTKLGKDAEGLTLAQLQAIEARAKALGVSPAEAFAAMPGNSKTQPKHEEVTT